jgi:3-methylfumaryl-CoA hydratase
VTPRPGRSGLLVFVKVRHDVHAGSDVVLTEWQDLVYRELGGGAAAPSPAPGDETARKALVPGDVLLFRYSALTLNSHRIHYDRRYCVQEEGYPGLVVHGPLLATLMARLAWDEGGRACPARLRFRARRPVFDGTPIEVCSRRAAGESATWIRTAGGELAMEGTVTW